MIETACFVDPCRNQSILGQRWAVHFDSGVFCWQSEMDVSGFSGGDNFKAAEGLPSP